jgi:Domain of unknown function (DUF1707)
MAGPGDARAPNAEGMGQLRASHADREHIVSVLKAAFVQGMLTKDEFDLRIGQVLASRMYAELAATTADIPPGLTPIKPLSPAKRDASDHKALKAWACLTGTFAAVAALVAAASGGGAGQNEFVAVLFVPMVAMLVGLLVALHEWLDRRAARRSSQDRRPAQLASPRPGH